MPTKWIAFSVNLLVALLFLREELAKRDIPWGALFFGLLVVYTITRGLWPWWADLALKGLALVVAVAPLVPGVLYANHTLLLVGWTSACQASSPSWQPWRESKPWQRSQAALYGW